MAKDQQKKGRLFVVSGPSGVGKGTLIRRLTKKCPNVRLSVSETTRAPRKHERHGIDYFFVSREDFQKGIDEDRYLEYNDHFEHAYGTPAAYVKNGLDAGYDVIVEIEYKGALQILEKMPDTISIFILPPTVEALDSRLTGRQSENRKQLALRRQRTLEELEAAYDYDYVIVNDDLDQAVEELIAVMTAEKHKGAAMGEKIHEIIGGLNGLSE